MIGAPSDDAHAKLIEWGIAIKTQFDIDNLHLTGRDSAEGAAKMVQAVKQLGSAHATMQGNLADIAVRQVAIENKLNQVFQLLMSTCAASDEHVCN